MVWFLEAIAAFDFYFDFRIMISLSESGELMWSTLTIFTMICPFLMCYGSLISLRVSYLTELKNKERYIELEKSHIDSESQEQEDANNHD